MKTVLSCAAFVVAGALAVPFAAAADKTDQPAKTQLSDQDFVKEAAEGGMAEVKLGKLAEANAASEDVKEFGRHMVKDHTAANEKLMDVAKSVKVSVPTGVDKDEQALMDQLSSLKGADFDRAYMAAMVKDHEEDIRLFEAESKNGTDAAVKQFASDTLPTLQAHLKMAQTINDKLKAK